MPNPDFVSDMEPVDVYQVSPSLSDVPDRVESANLDLAAAISAPNVEYLSLIIQPGTSVNVLDMDAARARVKIGVVSQTTPVVVSGQSLSGYVAAWDATTDNLPPYAFPGAAIFNAKVNWTEIRGQEEIWLSILSTSSPATVVSLMIERYASA